VTKQRIPRLAPAAAALLAAFALRGESPAPKPPAPKKIVLVRTGALVDVLAGRVLANQDVLIEDGIVKQVGPGIAAPAGAAVVDLTKRTVLPGLIDVHTHVTSQPEDYYADRFRR
jgi:imidazolonepropionase-like amidohydrolase